MSTVNVNGPVRAAPLSFAHIVSYAVPRVVLRHVLLLAACAHFQYQLTSTTHEYSSDQPQLGALVRLSKASCQTDTTGLTEAEVQ